MKRLAVPALVLLLAGPASLLRGQGDFQKGISYYKQGQFQKAIDEFEPIVKASPDYEAGYRVLGDCYLRLKNYAKAASAFQRAIELDDSFFASHLGAAVAQFNLGRPQDAVAALLRGEATAKAPRERYQLHQLRGSAYYKLARFKEAAADLEKAVSIQRGAFTDVFQLGVAYYRLGDNTSARRYLEQAAALKPDSVEARQFLSQVDFREAGAAIEAKQYGKAVQLLTRVVREKPDDAEAWYNLGLAQLFNDQLEPAETAFNQSAALAPGNWETHNRLGYVYEVRKQYPEALKSYARALELHSDPALAESVKRIEERIRRQQNG